MSIDTKIRTAAGSLPRLRRAKAGEDNRPKADSPAVDVPETASRLPEPPRVAGRRNPRWIALGVVALCLGGLLSYMIYAQVAAQSAVVTMARTVDRGAVIVAADLTTTTVSGTTKASTVPADRLPNLVGQRAAYDLVEGALVPAAAIAAEPLPATGRAVVGLKLSQGRAPVGLLTASAPVRLVTLPADDAGQSTEAQTYLGRVVDVSDGADGTSVLVNVDVAAADAPTIAQLAAQDRLAMLRDADK